MREQVGDEPRHDVDLSFAQREGHRLLVAVVAEHDLVDGRRAAPVVRVRLHPPVLPLLPLHELEGAGAHGRDVVELLRGLHVAIEAAPDVLGQDRDPGRREGRERRRLRVPDQRVVVGGREGGVVREVVVVGPDVVVEHESIREGDVVRRHRLPVRPRNAPADVEGPGEAVLGLAAVLDAGDLFGQTGCRCHRLLVEVEQHVVVDPDELVLGPASTGTKRVRRVQVVGEPHGEGDLRPRRRRWRLRERRVGDAPHEGGGQQRDECADDAAHGRPPPRGGSHISPDRG